MTTPEVPMSRPTYEAAIASFDWAQAHTALGWKPGAKVSLAAAIVDRHAESGRTALVFIDRNGQARRIGYRELSEASNRFANVLRRHGVAVGDRVAGMMPRCPEGLITILGALKAGAIYVPIFTGFGPDAVSYRLGHAQAKVLVTHADVLDQVPGDYAGVMVVAGSGRPLRTGAVDFAAASAAESDRFDPVLLDRDDPAAII